jgi:hypothetical protein
LILLRQLFLSPIEYGINSSSNPEIEFLDARFREHDKMEELMKIQILITSPWFSSRGMTLMEEIL